MRPRKKVVTGKGKYSQAGYAHTQHKTARNPLEEGVLIKPMRTKKMAPGVLKSKDILLALIAILA